MDQTSIRKTWYSSENEAIIITATTENITEELKWESSNPSRVSITADGNVATITVDSVRPGTYNNETIEAVITATANGVEATCTIRVYVVRDATRPIK